jgi:glucokinase
MDLGGTQMRAAWVASENAIGPILRRPTNANRPAEDCLTDILQLIRDVIDQTKSQGQTVTGVAVGAPAPTDHEGRLIHSGNLPTMGEFPLQRRLAEALDLAVSVHSDADCFAMGEASRNGHVESFCGITLGTGLGVGIVIDGRIYRGTHGTAGEVWKSPWGDGTIENILSGPAIETMYRERTDQTVDGAEITKRATEDDATARDVYEIFGLALGGALAWIINLIDPAAVALGGGVASAFALFENPMRKQLKRHVVVSPPPEIYPSENSDTATLWGAVCLHTILFPESPKT